MSNKLKLVIFDMDGVLVDACDWHRVALNESLKEVSGCEITLDEHYGKYNGLPTKTKLNMLLEEGRIQASDMERIHEIKQDKTVEIIKRDSEIKLEKIELMKWLKSESIQVACFTNSIRRTAELMLDKAGILDHLELLVTNQDVSQPKPSPEGYIKVLNHFKIDPLSAIIVEDSPKGQKAAMETDCVLMKVKDATEVTLETVKGFINENFNTNGG